MSVAPGNNNQGIEIEESPAERIIEVEAGEASYAVYKLGEDVKGYSDFAKGELLVENGGKPLLKLDKGKGKYSLKPEHDGKALEVYKPEDEDYRLVIQRIDDYSVQEVPEQDKKEIRQTLESLD